FSCRGNLQLKRCQFSRQYYSHPGNASATHNRRDCKSTCNVTATSWRGTNQPPRSCDEYIPVVTNISTTLAATVALRSMLLADEVANHRSLPVRTQPVGLKQIRPRHDSL